MRFARQIVLPVVLALAASNPVSAQSDRKSEPAVVPEPNDLLLFGLGLVGLIVGRRVARKKSDD